MSDVEAKKLQEEIERLEVDAKAVEYACTTSEAAKKIGEYCQGTTDPFLGENESSNPWQQSGQGGSGCIIL